MEEAGWKDKLNFWIQRLLPQHALSGFMGWLSRHRAPKWLLLPILRWFCGRYGVDLSESASPLEEFSSF
ncbi:MAG: phosphatidylserine decarboxylase, partial [Bdellovibrionota bacterium]